MSTKAYVLIETVVGKSREVMASLQGLPELESLDAVTGPYDIIAVVTAADLNTVGKLVTGNIHNIGGILRTVTCLTITGPKRPSPQS